MNNEIGNNYSLLRNSPLSQKRKHLSTFRNPKISMQQNSDIQSLFIDQQKDFFLFDSIYQIKPPVPKEPILSSIKIKRNPIFKIGQLKSIEKNERLKDMYKIANQSCL